MENKNSIIDFEGSISFETMEKLLNQLKSASQFNALRKPVRKRVYGTVVESIDNIFKYATPFKNKGKLQNKPPQIIVKEADGKFIVSAGNLIRNDQVEDLKYKLNRINMMDDDELKSLYEEVINKEAKEEDRGAGLGLITMALRTEKDIKYSFSQVDDDYAFFEYEITLNG